MTGQVQLPDAIDPDAPYMEFRVNQCKVCGDVGPLCNVDNPEWHLWFTRHRHATGHDTFFEYKIARSAGREYVMRPARRTLGRRDV